MEEESEEVVFVFSHHFFSLLFLRFVSTLSSLSALSPFP